MRQLMLIAAIGVHHINLIVPIPLSIKQSSNKHNLLTVGGPGGRYIIFLIVRQTRLIVSEGTHHVDFSISISIGAKHNFALKGGCDQQKADYQN